MLKEERQQLILNILAEEQRVIASELSQRFKVSEDTIRRDLKELDQQGLLKRVHSGALKAGPPVATFSTRCNIEHDAKLLLAHKAIPLIKQGVTILIDGGTSNLELAKQLPQDFKATIITNSPPLAVALEHYANIEVIVIGGTLYKESMVNLGIDVAQSLNKMRVDYYLMGIYNIDPQMGISVPTLQEAQVKRIMLGVSTEVIGLVTPDKIGTVSKHIIAPASALTSLVTGNIEGKLRQNFADLNISIIS